MNEKTRAERYRATRSHFPLKPARDVLDAIRQRAPWVCSYAKWTRPYNPRIEDSHDHERWVENVHEAGLRFVGYADEILGLRHTGWNTDPWGDWGVLRGAVWQLPARDGSAVYVHGYEDTENKGSALVCFDVQYGEPGGSEYDHEQAGRDAARCADSMAEYAAEKERDYQATESAKIRADELRDEAREMRASLCDTIRTVRESISDLLSEARELEDDPYSLFY